MSYQVLLSKTARKTYDKLPPKLQKGVDRAIEYLKVNSQPIRRSWLFLISARSIPLECAPKSKYPFLV
jgi:mRNA-degrading endonuclease RelE of RelBE toxin-antitoxin system